MTFYFSLPTRGAVQISTRLERFCQNSSFLPTCFSQDRNASEEISGNPAKRTAEQSIRFTGIDAEMPSDNNEGEASAHTKI